MFVLSFKYHCKWKYCTRIKESYFTRKYRKGPPNKLQTLQLLYRYLVFTTSVDSAQFFERNDLLSSFTVLWRKSKCDRLLFYKTDLVNTEAIIVQNRYIALDIMERNSVTQAQWELTLEKYMEDMPYDSLLKRFSSCQSSSYTSVSISLVNSRELGVSGWNTLNIRRFESVSISSGITVLNFNKLTDGSFKISLICNISAEQKSSIVLVHHSQQFIFPKLRGIVLTTEKWVYLKPNMSPLPISSMHEFGGVGSIAASKA